MRESNAPGAKKAQLMTNLSQFHRREFRTAANGQAQPQQFASNGRYWLRIVRAGNQFTMYVSANGMSWFPIGAQNIVMGNCIQMGLVATNYTANSTVTATFANVSFTGSNAGLGLPGKAVGRARELTVHSTKFRGVSQPDGRRAECGFDAVHRAQRAHRSVQHRRQVVAIQRDRGGANHVESLNLSRLAKRHVFGKSEICRPAGFIKNCSVV
jgi:hypothetical protein